MIVSCQNCNTSFNLDDTQIPEEGVWVRCSKCQNTFQVEPAASAPAMASQPAPAADEGQEEPSLDFRLKVNPDSALSASFGLRQDEEDETRGRPSKFNLIFWLLAVLAVFSLVGSGCLVAIDRLGIAPGLVSMFHEVPILGGMLGRDAGPVQGQPAPPDNQGLILNQVRGYYRVNQAIGKIFVVQGLVENQMDKARSGILVRGRLNDTMGNPARQAIVYAGPVFTPDELRQSSLQDIQARLGQSKDPNGGEFILAPQGTIPFMIVFANLPDNLAEFTAEVVGSEYMDAQ